MINKNTTDDMYEYFYVVDENDKIVSKATRQECHVKGLLHRAVDIVIINSKHEILLQKRSVTKDLYKGYWAISASGHVTYGDSYEEAAKREMEEEIGIKTKLDKLFDFRKRAGNDNEVIRAFLGKHDGPFTINKKEVNFVKFFSLDEINIMLKKEKFTSSTIEIFKRIKKDPKLKDRIFSL